MRRGLNKSLAYFQLIFVTLFNQFSLLGLQINYMPGGYYRDKYVNKCARSLR